ncbi:unnamed protein product [Sphagnum jensenii]|uniref:Pentatricopeptide repeat-containing protein n=2 Tax=Sphagnum jensenii TaxID=128206 RepID=A0ABP1A412_9BRYO
MDLCRDASRISESLEGLKMKRESHRNSRGNGEAVRELCKGGRLKKVLQILDYNDPEGKQAYSGAAYASLLQSCAKLKAITEGNQIHAHISKAGFEPDIFLCSTIISMYTKCMSVAEVMEVLDKMLQRDIVSWNAVIAGYAQNEFSMEVSELFAQMQQEVLRHGTFIFDVGFESDISVGTALISMYARCGSALNAQQVFDAYRLCDCMAVFSMGNEYSVELFQRMQQEGVNPDRISFVSVLNAFTTPTVLELGKFVQTHIIKQGLDSDVGIGNALINIFSRCGSLADACQVLDGMPRCDVVPWTAMISGYAQHQHAGYALHVLGKPTLELFKQMQIEGVKPDNDTFVAVLSACSHAGLVDEGYCHFLSITKDHGIVPTVQHHGCLVSLLGHAGCFNEAMEFITEMPCQPDAMLCGTLLPACRVDCEVQLAEHAAHDLLKLDPQKASVYELLSKVYAAAGRWDNVVKIQNLMKERAVRKEAGHSWIKVRNRMHTFVAEDISHFQTEIYAMLRDLRKQMKDADYVTNTSFVLLGRKCWHSTFGLISTSPGTPVCIFKNFQTCENYCIATMFISKLKAHENHYNGF